MSELGQKVKERLMAFIEYKELSVSAFEKACGLSNGYIRNFQGNLGGAKLEGILNAFPELDRNWLLYGKERSFEVETISDASIELPRLEAERIPQLSNTEILLRDMLAEERARVDALNEMIWELKEENGKLKALLNSERKGGTAANAGFSSAVDVV